jgi:hypothetical protein
LSLPDNIPYCSWPSLHWQLQHMQAHCRHIDVQGYKITHPARIHWFCNTRNKQGKSPDLKIWFEFSNANDPHPLFSACIISFFIISHRPPHQKEILGPCCGIKFQIESFTYVISLAGKRSNKSPTANTSSWYQKSPHQWTQLQISKLSKAAK